MKLRYALLICLAALTLSLAAEAFAVLVFAAVVWLGLVLAVRLRPGLADLITRRRLPRATEWAALAVGQVGGFVTVVGLTLGLAGVTTVLGRHADISGMISWGLAAVWVVASGLPLWLEIRGAGRAGAGEPALGPIAAGLAGGAVLGLGLFLMRQTLIDPMLERPYASAVFGAVLFIPIWGLMASAGAIAAFEALAGRGDIARPARRVAAVTAALWAVVAVWMVADLAGFGLPGVPRVTTANGGEPAAVYATVIALAWVATFWRLRALEIRNAPTAGMAGLLLLIVGVTSLAAPAGVMGSEWAPLVAVILFPVLVISALVVLVVVVPALRWLTGDRSRPSMR
ncbi:MAG: hypothetical protein EBR82_76590, partial [Caulobacteraceae bacterium]|nr:hypothetical protein [Caulobacteraceae bacterium]